MSLISVELTLYITTLGIRSANRIHPWDGIFHFTKNIAVY